MTFVPSITSLRAKTLKGTGNVLLHLQCVGSIVQTKFGLSVRTSSPGYSAKSSEKDFSPLNRFEGGMPSELQLEVVSDAMISFMCSTGMY